MLSSHCIKLTDLPKIHHDQNLAEIIGSGGSKNVRVKQMRAVAKIRTCALSEIGRG
jgi:hypothetical protein